MPIKDISDRRRLPKGGRLHIGIKVWKTRHDGSTYEVPEKIDHFRFDPEDEALLVDFSDLYGPAPKSLPIMFYSDSREEIFPHYLKFWRSGKLWCWGDGQVAHRADFEKGTTTDIPCLPDCPYRKLPKEQQYRLSPEEKKQRQCGPQGELRFILYELPTLAVFSITASLTSIVRINTGLDMIQAVTGRLAHVPLILGVVPVQQVVGGKNNTNFCLQLDVRTSLLDLLKTRDATTPAGLLEAPPEPESEAGDAEQTEAHSTTQATSEQPPRDPGETFSDVMKQALDQGLVTQAVHDAAVAWAKDVPQDCLEKKIKKWQGKLQNVHPPPPTTCTTNGKPLDPVSLAEQIATTLEDDLALGHARNDLFDILLKHPALDSQRDRLDNHFSQAQGDSGIETATLYEARRLILAAGKADEKKG